MNECHKITHKGELRLVAPVTAPIGGSFGKARGEWHQKRSFRYGSKRPRGDPVIFLPQV